MNSNPMPSAQAPVIRDNVLKAENLSKQVSSPEGALTIVHGVSLDIAAGESVAVVGSSGAGKSTLLALLAGLDLPTTGRVLLEGTDLTRSTRTAGRDCGPNVSASSSSHSISFRR
jgi:predicted ABC-type transport system involved in lysophospholipase L1 biosynthesis ATPase subunit